MIARSFVLGGTDDMISAMSVANRPKEDSDLIHHIQVEYGNALLTVLWADYNGASHLVFAAIDFYPKELHEISEVTLDSIDLGENSKYEMPDIKLNFCRRRMCCSEALELYRNCCTSGRLSVEDALSGEIILADSSKTKEYPMWPDMTISKRSEELACPFISESWDCCRMHHVLSDSLDNELLLLAEHSIPIQWMKEHLAWDISVYPELLGSMHLILPNPWIRSIAERLIPGTPNRVSVCLELRADWTMKDLKGMKYVGVERGGFGMRTVHEQNLSELSTTDFIIELSKGDTDEFASALYDEKWGILEWSQFGYFLMGFDIDMRVVNAKRRIHIPGHKTPYEVDIYESTGKVTTEEKKEDDTWGRRMAYQREKRKQGKYAEQFGQHFFVPAEPKAAEEFIRDLVKQAKKQVIIIDPFFATIEFFKFVLAIPSPVDVTIITDKDTLNMESKHSGIESKTVTIGEEICHILKQFKSQLPGYEIKIEVMTGKKPIIHDRFLIIDDQVWFSGNSLNDIGTRLSTIIRLPNPRELLNHLETIKSAKTKRIITLEEWAKNRKKVQNGRA